MKNINLVEEKKALERINGFYKKNQDRRENIGFGLAFFTPIIFPIFIMGVIIKNSGHNISNRIEPIKAIMETIATLESEDKPSIQTLAIVKNSISSCLSTIESCPSKSREYRDLVAAIQNIKNKISAELESRLNHRINIETGAFAMKFTPINKSAFTPGIRQNILSFMDGRCIQNPSFKNEPIETGMELG